MHGLANYAQRLGLAPKMNPTRKFCKLFWDNISKNGRVNEMRLSVGLYFMDGLLPGIKKSFEMAGIGWGMLRTGRMNPPAFFHHRCCKDAKTIQKMLKKAREIEDRRKGFAA